MYDVHYWPTPNGKKVTILLEELGAQYKIVPCNIGRGDQFTPDFLKMNPNHRMPVLVDHSPKDGSEPIEHVIEQRLAADLHERLGQRAVVEGPHAGAEAGGEHHRGCR